MSVLIRIATKDGKIRCGSATDMGVLEVRDGRGKPWRAYVTRFRFDDRDVVSEADAELSPLRSPAEDLAARLYEDKANLDAAGFDASTLEVLT